MKRTQFILLTITAPLWLGVVLVLWARSPLFILIPCGILLTLVIISSGALIYAAELTTKEDWDLVIRSILHRLGFQVSPPRSLMQDIELNHPEHWHDHVHDPETVEKDT